MPISEILSKFQHRDHDEYSSSVPLELRIAAFLFRGKRSDYYRYLADMIEGTKGRMLLRDIFAADARRYAGSARGKLSAFWTRQFDNGGSLAKTFSGTLPKSDVAFIDTLQKASAEGGLESGLRDLADNTGLVAKAKRMVLLSMAASLVCVAVVLTIVIGMPFFTVPKIQMAFSMLPPEEYPKSAARLFSFAKFISTYWIHCIIIVTVVIFGIMASLGVMTGKVRIFLDKYGVVWGMYRDFQSIRFLSGFSAMIRKRGNKSHVLREALIMQLPGASRWQKHHLNRMIDMVDRGEGGAPIFETGMLDRETAWYIADLISSRGLEDALQFVRERLEGRVMSRLFIQSSLLSWGLMISGILVSAYLMFWHMVAIDALRIALQQYLS